jgi:hypothetical protein
MIDKNEERLSFENTLTTALTQRHCTICYILSDKIYSLLCQLQYEVQHDSEVHTSVVAAGGYCHFHFWYLEKLTNPVTNAQLLESLLEGIRAELLRWQNVPERVAACLATAERCPVCCICRGWEEELLALFAARIPEKGFWAAYQHCWGLCLPHLVQILERLPDPEARAALITATCRQLDVLLQELRLQIVRRHTKDRSQGEEGDSTYRAIEKLVGGNKPRAR